ncbi:MAG: cellulase family glycosylhydrolase [Methylococcales bacterium]
MFKITSTILFSIIISSCAYFETNNIATNDSQFGLTVSAQGVLQKDGAPYIGIGVNYFDAFCRVLKNNNDKSYQRGFKELSRLGIPFVRFMASGYWPNDMKLYIKNPKKYFALLDEVVASAEKNNIGLIPSLFWNEAMVSDLVGEPLNQWGNPKSKTHQFMRKYTQQIVTRYKSSPAIWGWEFGNEMNLRVDLPNASDYRAQIEPKRGTAKFRTDKDELSSKNLSIALVEFAKMVRQLDKYRMLSSGNSMPRASAYHNSYDKNWQLDTRKQTQNIIKRDNPDPIDTVSVHFYANNEYFKRKKNYDRFIDNLKEVAKTERKPVFIGEFGLCNGAGISLSKASGEFKKLLAVMKNGRIPLAALWVYDLDSQKGTCNITKTNARSYQLKSIEKSN